MYNPTEIQYSRSATYSEISAPGSPYPTVAFVKGDVSSLPVKLFLSDKAAKGDIQEFIDFIEAFLPEENSNALFRKPILLTISLGNLIKKCVLIKFDVNIMEYSNIGIPKRAELSLELKVVA